MNVLISCFVLLVLIIAETYGQNGNVTTTQVVPTTTEAPVCVNPFNSINTTNGKATISDSQALESINCTWSFGIDSSNGYMALIKEGIEIWNSILTNLDVRVSSAPYELELTVAGNLRLVDESSDIVWQTDTTNAGERPYQLTLNGTNGNVYLTDNANASVWELYCENNAPYFTSDDLINQFTSIYATNCIIQLRLSDDTIEIRDYYEWSDLGTDSNWNILDTLIEEINSTIEYTTPYYIGINTKGKLGVVDSNGVFLWTVKYTYEDSGTAPFYLTISEDGTLSVFDSLDKKIWDTAIEIPLFTPTSEIIEILVLVLYFSIFLILIELMVFRTAYLTRKRKNYVRDTESGAMHYGKRAELRNKLQEVVSMSDLQALNSFGDGVVDLLLDPDQLQSDSDVDKDDKKEDNEDSESLNTDSGMDDEKDDKKANADSDDEDSDGNKKKSRPKRKVRKTKSGRVLSSEDTRSQILASSRAGFKALSASHFHRCFIMLKLFNDLSWITLLHFLCNASSYAILVRWCLAIWGSNKWAPESIGNEQMKIITYMLISILFIYQIISAILLRASYRKTFYGLSNSEYLRYEEKRTMQHVFWQQLFDVRIIRELRNSILDEQLSQFVDVLVKTKYSLSAIPQSILFLYYILTVNNYSQSWLIFIGLISQLLYILTRNISADDEVFSSKAQQKCPPSIGFILRFIFRSVEVLSRIGVFALAAIVIHWVGVIVLLLYHLFANFMFFQGSLLGKDELNIFYFILTVPDLGLISRRREIDSWVNNCLKFVVHFARVMTCFLVPSAMDSICHCIRTDEQLLFDFIFGRVIESLGELGIIYYLASWHIDGFPISTQEGTLLMVSGISAIVFFLIFLLLRCTKQFDHNNSRHRYALNLAKDERWDMLSDFIPLYTSDEINRKDRFGNRETILIYSAQERQPKIVMQLLDCKADVFIGDRKGNTALHKAAKNGRIDILDALLDCGANPNQPNYAGWTALHVACREGHEECVKKLVGKDAQPLAVMYENLTCIGVAMRFSSLDLVKYLLKQVEVTHYTDSQLEEVIEYVRDVNDIGGPLVHALHYGESKIAKVLLECRVQYINAKDHFGETALHKACSWGYTKIAKELVVKYKADVNIISDKEYSPYHIAIAKQFPRIVNMLVDNGVKIQLPTSAFGNQVLLRTCKTGYHNIFKQIMQFDNKIDVDVRDLEGNTPLLLAAQNKNTKICKELIVNGADVTARNMWGRSIFDTKLPKKLREAVNHVLKVQSGLIAMHGDGVGATPGMNVTPGMEDVAPGGGKQGDFLPDDDDQGIMGLGDGGGPKKKVDDDDGALVPESQGLLGWGPGGGPGGGGPGGGGPGGGPGNDESNL